MHLKPLFFSSAVMRDEEKGSRKGEELSAAIMARMMKGKVLVASGEAFASGRADDCALCLCGRVRMWRRVEVGGEGFWA